MVIRKNFKIISEDKHKKQNSQVITTLSSEEKEKITNSLKTFFTSIKTLLEEGAVIVEDNPNSTTNHKQYDDLEEEFIQNPYLNSTSGSIYNIALNVLPKEKVDEFRKSIKGVKLTKEYEFNFETDLKSEMQEYLEQAISNQLQDYAKNLPQIMEKRKKNLQILFDIRPDIKKYLENIKK